MKTVKAIKWSIMTLIFSLAFFACSDDDDPVDPPPAEPTVTELVQNQWNVVNIMDINYKGNTTVEDYRDTFITGGTIEFRSDSSAILKIDGDTDTSDYLIVSDELIMLDGEPFKINELTSSSLIMTYEERIDTPFYDNIVTLKR